MALRRRRGGGQSRVRGLAARLPAHAPSEAQCDRVFQDRTSGAKAKRPGLIACLDYLRRGDVLVVLDLGRLGRLASELVTLIDQLAERGIAFRALNSPMDTATPAGRAFLQIQAVSPRWSAT